MVFDSGSDHGGNRHDDATIDEEKQELYNHPDPRLVHVAENAYQNVHDIITDGLSIRS